MAMQPSDGRTLFGTVALGCPPDLRRPGGLDVTVQRPAACPSRSNPEAHGFGPNRCPAHPLRIEEGAAVAPDRPGHGVVLDWAGLAGVRA
ncbi:MAG: hypothetical protein K2X74_15205 [Acetobacteraceae bacterium]|nr:hypothetical protein [Acetobacteraceae bacterium]